MTVPLTHLVICNKIVITLRPLSAQTASWDLSSPLQLMLCISFISIQGDISASLHHQFIHQAIPSLQCDDVL